MFVLDINSGLILNWFGFTNVYNNGNCYYTFPITYKSWWRSTGNAYGGGYTVPSHYVQSPTVASLSTYYGAVSGGDKYRDFFVIGV